MHALVKSIENLVNFMKKLSALKQKNFFINFFCKYLSFLSPVRRIPKEPSKIYGEQDKKI